MVNLKHSCHKETQRVFSGETLTSLGSQRGMKIGSRTLYGCDWRRHKACGYLPVNDIFSEQKGDVLGKKIELFVEDDQHDPKLAVTVANKLSNSGAAGVIERSEAISFL
ncbi:MAG: hypothetical protein HZB79_03060 [Deltaproteobacteria bacterium]|nr:hypothetical protein [Deltaproteobacteria bacterium]